MRLLGRKILAITVSVMIPASAAAQRKPAAPFPSLSQFASRSVHIFSGTVIRVQRTSAPENTVASTQITFRVEGAIQGVRSGEALTIREWSGLWDSGEQYRPGERVLLFLYPTSKLGFTSPVGGSLGRFAVDDSGNIHVNEPQRTFLSFKHGQPRFAGRTRVSPHEFAHAVLALRNVHGQIP
jgi:hypothetical protein